jgi:hypothetical protein
MMRTFLHMDDGSICSSLMDEVRSEHSYKRMRKPHLDVSGLRDSAVIYQFLRAFTEIGAQQSTSEETLEVISCQLFCTPITVVKI